MPETQRTIRLGTRGSDLALAQADMLTEALLEAHPGLNIERKIITTTGDLNQKPMPRRKKSETASTAASKTAPLDKSAFTKELETALADNEIDIAVHSLKDVPTEIDSAFSLAGCLPRGAVEDVYVTRRQLPGGIKDAPENWIIGTSSVRRERLIREVNPHVQIKPLRGNVPTRLRKLAYGGGHLHGIVLARAGLERLGYQPASGWVFYEGREMYGIIQDPDEFVPAACQGAIGFEIRSDDFDSAFLLDSVNHAYSWARVRCERHFLALLQAGCQTPIGIHTTPTDKGDALRARAAVFPEDDPTAPATHIEAVGSPRDPEGLAAALFEIYQRARSFEQP